jgi:hypothetical protein
MRHLPASFPARWSSRQKAMSLYLPIQGWVSVALGVAVCSANKLLAAVERMEIALGCDLARLPTVDAWMYYPALETLWNASSAKPAVCTILCAMW